LPNKQYMRIYAIKLTASNKKARKARKNYFERVRFEILAKNKIAIVNHSNGD